MKTITHFARAALTLAALALLGPLPAPGQPSAPKTIATLATITTNAAEPSTPAIGEWDGVTPSVHLSYPYEDPKQLNIPFGIYSYYMQPWHGYMDTWPASQYQNLPGVNWNIDARYAEPVSQILQESGIRSVRVEIGWGSIGWDDNLTPSAKAYMDTLFAAFQRHGIRPLILLNAHHGNPCPSRNVTVQVVAAAKAGDTTLKLANTSGVRPGYTGLMNPAYIAAYPVITSVSADGTATLSSGLPNDVPVGPLTLIDLKYQPFQGIQLSNGKSVPTAWDTYHGWMLYVAAVANEARQALGTVGQADAGFDVEVWNELTFGSNFLDINNYYDKKFNFVKPFTYKKTRSSQDLLVPGAQTVWTAQGPESILPMTVDYFTNPAHGFPDVNVISGFSNQTPWESGTGLWPGQAGFSRHFYTGGITDIAPGQPYGNPRIETVNALGGLDGQRDFKDWETIIPGTNFIPTYRMSFPEYWHAALQTETMSRDLSPDSRLTGTPGWMGTHGRYTNDGDLRPAQVWETETNYFRAPFFGQLQQQTGVGGNDPRMLALAQWMDGKMLLRQYLFHASKGMHRIMCYGLAPDPYGLGLLPQALLTALDQNGDVLTDQARQTIPTGLLAMARINTLMSRGQSLDVTRPLSVQDVVEYQPRLVFAGDGTPAHPDRTNVDQFAFLPFQLSAKQYAIPYYVMSLDVSHVWSKKWSPLNHARYDMPDQGFDVTIANVRGQGATVVAYDPLTDKSVPVSVVSSSPTTLTVHLRAVDYPRFLMLTEQSNGPLIQQPQVSNLGGGHIKVTWSTNVPANAVVSFGSDWTKRGGQAVSVPASGQLTNSVTFTGVIFGVPAVRITVTDANGLSDVWPRWDEDPAGQVVLPPSS